MLGTRLEVELFKRFLWAANERDGITSSHKQQEHRSMWCLNGICTRC